MKNRIYSVAENFRRTTAGTFEICTCREMPAALRAKAAVVLRTGAPVIAVLLLNLLLHEAIRAQNNGPIFSGSANNLANIVREGLKLFAILLFCGGALGVGAAIWNKMWGKEWANYAIGGGAAFAFGTIMAVIYAIAQGQNVTVDTNF